MSDQELDGLTRGMGRAIRAERTARGMSLGDLGRASGLSKTILSRIEAGEGNPSVETLWRVSQAFDLPLGALLGDADRPPARAVARRSGRRLGADSGMTAWLIHAEGQAHRSEVYELDLPAGVVHPGRPHLPGTTEVVVCTKGRLRVGPDAEPLELGPGDAAWFASDVPHRYEALRASVALCLMLYPAGAER
jgi:XRE family transcriptional regulator, regulator of sulfur utilization